MYERLDEVDMTRGCDRGAILKLGKISVHVVEQCWWQVGHFKNIDCRDISILGEIKSERERKKQREGERESPRERERERDRGGGWPKVKG